MGSDRVRWVAFVLVGFLGFWLTSVYRGAYSDAVHAYGGNITASFGVYFLAVIAAWRLGWSPQARMLGAAVAALVVVEAFELTNGFGVMTNVYDRFDLLANAAGVLLALLVESATTGWRTTHPPALAG